MANIAQTINVLQAMILTDKARMILTPTYHVFEMYTVHQDATLLPTELQSSDYLLGADKIPNLSASASQDKAGRIHLSLCNLNPHAATELSCQLQGAKPTAIAGRVLTAPEITSHNTFDQPDLVRPTEFNACRLTEDGFRATLPPRSVVVLELR